MKKQFRPAKMVNWFEPRILLQTGIKALVSGLFGNYADRREMEAALDNQADDSKWNDLIKNYRERQEIWIDFISDTGDGFNSTYSVAHLAAQPELSFNIDGREVKLPRSKILVLGGDQVYPSPTADLYDSNFRIPFEAALPEDKTDEDFPHMYAIPGNHDWYDGLGNFIKVFCQQRWIGNWQTQQSRSYFALPLPNNYWLWATDIQLNEDIDKPQLDYFCSIAKNKMQPGDKVILCTAEPAWVYKQLYKNDKTYERLQFFIETYITKDKADCIGKTFRLALVLTGDLHHYAHYCRNEAEENASHHFIGAGGGGAFMHLTHNLPEHLSKLDEKGIRLQRAFPDKKDSRRLLSGCLAFPFINYYFSFFLLGSLYVLFFWLLQSHSLISAKAGFLERIYDTSLAGYARLTFNTLAVHPFLSLLSIGIIAGFYQFTDIKTGRKGVKLLGLLHGLLQCLLIFLLIRCIAEVHQNILENAGTGTYWSLLFAAELLIGGGLLGGFLMGLYLFIANLFFKIHLDESSSALIGEDYKSFFRIHISQKGLVIYPVGIKETTKKWKQEQDGDQIRFTGKTPEYHLIEKPIHINL